LETKEVRREPANEFAAELWPDANPDLCKVADNDVTDPDRGGKGTDLELLPAWSSPAPSSTVGAVTVIEKRPPPPGLGASELEGAVLDDALSAAASPVLGVLTASVGGLVPGLMPCVSVTGVLSGKD
jgi:hypothetical protein